MTLRSVTIIISVLLLSPPSFGQTKDSLTLQFEAEDQDVPDSLVDSFLDMVYGKLSTEIANILSDSGAINSDKLRIGKWNEYYYKPCLLCSQDKIVYDSILKHNTENPGNIFFFRETGQYQSGKRQGMWHTYNTDKLSEPFNWRLSSQVEYIENDREGWEHKYLYSADSARYTYRKIFYQNGKENGPIYGFNENGDTILSGQNKNGSRHGLFRFKKDNIVPFNFDRVYENGVEIESIFYHKNGVIASRGLLIDFQPHGQYKTYSESGHLIMEQTFNFGILEGESRYYYDNGKLKMIQNYMNNELNGISKYYHTNGQLWGEAEVRANKPWTVISNFDKNGKNKDKGTLKNGNGSMKRYNENGKLIAIEYYKDGELTREENK